jgi:hypothetical protein
LSSRFKIPKILGIPRKFLGPTISKILGIPRKFLGPTISKILGIPTAKFLL